MLFAGSEHNIGIISPTTAVVVNLEDYQVIMKVGDENCEYSALAFSANGRNVCIYDSGPSSLKIYSIQTQELIQTYPGNV